MKIEKKFVFSTEDGKAVEQVADLVVQLLNEGRIKRIVSTSKCTGAHQEINLNELLNTLNELLMCIGIQGAYYSFKEE